MQHGDIDVTGDVIIAQQFQKLLYYGRPDIEEELSTVIGDAAAFRGKVETLRDDVSRLEARIGNLASRRAQKGLA